VSIALWKYVTYKETYFVVIIRRKTHLMILLLLLYEVFNDIANENISTIL